MAAIPPITGPPTIAAAGPISLTFSATLYQRLHRHLFPGDEDEHGAVVAVGVAKSHQGTRLLARELFLAEDGRDYVPGRRGYRMLTADFVRDRALYCRDEGWGYLAVHNHGGLDSVGFSADDLASHERGYPALVDVLRGWPVGALVFAQDAVAGDIWWPGGRAPLESATVVGRRIRTLTPAPPVVPASDSGYDRQTRLLGDRGQAILRRAHVGVIGAGGVGSLLIEYLARLGIGRITVVDPDRLDETNLPRVVDSSRRDLSSWLSWIPLPQMRDRAARRASPKVKIAERVARRANPHGVIDALQRDFLDYDVAPTFTDCDYLFLAADTMRCRLLYNAITQQYLIPGVQVGSKALVEQASGRLLDVYSVIRPATLGGGCLWCNGLIPPARLQQEAATEQELRAQRYVEDTAVAAPSVITLNAVGASYAANAFLFGMTGLAPDNTDPLPYVRIDARAGDVYFDEPRIDPCCPECSAASGSRLARGHNPNWPLPIKHPPLITTITATT
jgi:hypothetical protein